MPTKPRGALITLKTTSRPKNSKEHFKTLENHKKPIAAWRNPKETYWATRTIEAQTFWDDLDMVVDVEIRKTRIK